MSRPIVVIACMLGSSESGRPIGDLCPGTYVPVEEPSTASEAVIWKCFSLKLPYDVQSLFPLSGGQTMDRTPPPVSLAAALALPRTPGRSSEVFVDGDLE